MSLGHIQSTDNDRLYILKNMHIVSCLFILSTNFLIGVWNKDQSSHKVVVLCILHWSTDRNLSTKGQYMPLSSLNSWISFRLIVAYVAT